MPAATAENTATPSDCQPNDSNQAEIRTPSIALMENGDFVMDENQCLVEYIGTDSEVIVPDGVRKIGFNAFSRNTYYLNPLSDSTRGKMVTGWLTIEGKEYYFNPNSDGSRGRLFRNESTGDGHFVDANGVKRY